MPTGDLLYSFGAKDPVAIASGEWWRFFAPIFVHIGFVHFAMNNLGLYFIGYQIEKAMGARWFLFIYLFSGFLGNVASACFSVARSAGASGALFGLLGAGFFLERVINKRIFAQTGEKPKNNVYSMMVIANVIFGFMVPGVDNAAHMGGLVAGIGLAYAMALSRPNRLFAPNPKRSKQVILALYGFAAVGVLFSMNSTYVASLLTAKAKQEAGLILDHDPDIAYFPYFLEEAKKLKPGDEKLRWLNFKILHHSGDKNAALLLLRGILKESGRKEDRDDLFKRVQDLLGKSKQRDNEYLKEFLKLQRD